MQIGHQIGSYLLASHPLRQLVMVGDLHWCPSTSSHGTKLVFAIWVWGHSKNNRSTVFLPFVSTKAMGFGALAVDLHPNHCPVCLAHRWWFGNYYCTTNMGYLSVLLILFLLIDAIFLWGKQGNPFLKNNPKVLI